MIPDADLLDLLHAAATSVERSLRSHADWGLAGTRAGQHHSDLAADAAARSVLDPAGVGVVSEESGTARLDADTVVVVDPLDGSTNASRRLPWYAVSLCAVDDVGLRAAVVADLSAGHRYDAVRGRGARRDGRRLRASGCEDLGEAIIGISGLPPRHLGWSQFRAFGALALDLCAVAEGRLDGFVDCDDDAHGPWDYLGGTLICREAGAFVADTFDRDLLTLDHGARRCPVAAATPDLLDALLDARRSFPPSDPETGQWPVP